MNGRKLVLIVALVLPSVALMAIPGSASASRAPAPTGTGTLTCSVEGGVSFHPALTYYPYPGGDRLRQVAEVGLQLTGCSGPDSNTPQPNPTAATVSFDGQTHLKYTKVEFMGHIMNGVGGCGYSNFDPDVHIGVDERWMGGSPVSKTHTGLEVETTGGFVSGHSFGSYPGAVSGTLNLTADSADQYNSVCNGSGEGNGSIGGLEFDPSTSTITIGESAP
jgi:hypothetical protein